MRADTPIAAGCWLVIIGLAVVAFMFLAPVVSWLAR